ncbi:MAG: hydroxyisourate hydrolase [Methylobacterium mesophilicum]|nr:hydroxyisourate hydrolase [Methylobacterium mesophilicum]
MSESHGRLTTHVLDTAKGRPAGGLAVSLYRLEGERRLLVAEAVTNADGRTDVPMLAGDAFRTGTYELEFKAGDYLRCTAPDLGSDLFLDVIPIRFGLTDHVHFHVPLLLSPFGYSTYRGS